MKFIGEAEMVQNAKATISTLRLTPRRFATGLAGLLLCSGAAMAADEKPTATPAPVVLDFTGEPAISNFEDDTLSPGLKASVGASGGKVSISYELAKEGKVALLWKWQGGDTLLLKVPPHVQGKALDAPWTPAAQFWLWSDKPNVQVAFEAFTDGARMAKTNPVLAEIEQPGGYRQVLFNYASNFGGVTRDHAMDAIALRMPDGAGEGTLRLDALIFDTCFNMSPSFPTPGRDKAKRDEAVALYQKVLDRYAPGKEPPVTDEDRKWVREIYKHLVLRQEGDKPAPAMKPEAALQSIASVTARDGSGKTFTRVPLEHQVHRERRWPLTGVKVFDWSKVTGFYDNISAAYAALPADSPKRKELGEAILRAVDYGRFQLSDEFALSSAVVLRIKDLLQARGLYDEYVAKAIQTDADFFTVVATPGRMPVNTNIEALGWYGGAVGGWLKGLFLLPDEERVVQAVRNFKAGLNAGILHSNPYGGYMDDGTPIHHGVPNWAYGSYCFGGFCNTLGNLYTRHHLLDADALAYMKRVLMRAEAYSAGSLVPFSMRGRWLAAPIPVTTTSFQQFALYGTLDGRIDPDAAAAYLNMKPEEAGKEPFLSIKGRPVPEQTFYMPWSCLLTHRRDGFLVNLKGANHEVGSFENMLGSNRLGRHQSYGVMEISNNPNGLDLSFEASGFSTDGLDWNHLPGTTCKPLPYEILNRQLGRPYGKEPFTGALASRDRNGIFVTHLRDLVDTTLVSKKSCFLFDNRVVCLGSNIECADAEYPIHTTLFQKYLTTPASAVSVNGGDVTTFPSEQEVPAVAGKGKGAKASWLIDPQGVGYILPAGQKAVLRRSHQKSFVATGNKPEVLDGPSEKDFATAWIDHGKAPKGAGYEYLVVINEMAEKVAATARATGTPKAAYTVLQKTEQAHVVRDNVTGLIGYAIFQPAETLPKDGFVVSCDRNFLLIGKREGNSKLSLTLSDPIMHLKPGDKYKIAIPFIYEPVTTTLRIKGQWKAASLPDKVKLEPTGSDTLIRFTSGDGLSTELELVAVK